MTQYSHDECQKLYNKIIIGFAVANTAASISRKVVEENGSLALEHLALSSQRCDMTS